MELRNAPPAHNEVTVGVVQVRQQCYRMLTLACAATRSTAHPRFGSYIGAPCLGEGGTCKCVSVLSLEARRNILVFSCVSGARRVDQHPPDSHVRRTFAQQGGL